MQFSQTHPIEDPQLRDFVQRVEGCAWLAEADRNLGRHRRFGTRSPIGFVAAHSRLTQRLAECVH